MYAIFQHLANGYVIGRVLQDSGLPFYLHPTVADAYVNMLFAQFFSKFSKD